MEGALLLQRFVHIPSILLCGPLLLCKPLVPMQFLACHYVLSLFFDSSFEEAQTHNGFTNYTTLPSHATCYHCNHRREHFSVATTLCLFITHVLLFFGVQYSFCLPAVIFLASKLSSVVLSIAVGTLKSSLHYNTKAYLFWCVVFVCNAGSYDHLFYDWICCFIHLKHTWKSHNWSILPAVHTLL
jgi:hypothetical protein